MENVRVRWGLEDVAVGDDLYGVGEERVAAHVFQGAPDRFERVPLIEATRDDSEGEEWAVRGKWSRRLLKQYQKEPTRVAT